MNNLIDKSALVAEIERRLNHQVYLSIEREIREQLLSGLLLFINTLEVKEVDLDFTKEVDVWIEDNGDTNGFFNVQDLAKHFFELGVSCPINNINIEEVKAAAKAWSEDDENTGGCDYIGATVAERAFVACAEWLINKAQKGE